MTSVASTTPATAPASTTPVPTTAVTTPDSEASATPERIPQSIANRTDRTDVDLPHLATDLRLACMRISRRVRFEQAGDGVAPHCFSVLARLGVGPATPSELAEREKVSAPSMTRTVATLVEAGLVERAGNPDDRRQVVISLTQAGQAQLDATRARRDVWMASRMVQLSEAEIAVLADAAPVLAKVAAL